MFSQAHAVTSCVSTIAQLKTQLFIGQVISNSDLVIKMVQGSYLLDADFDYLFAAPASLEGGYTANCAARQVNPANTVIDAQGHSVRFMQIAGAPQAQLSMEGLKVTNASFLRLTAGGFGSTGGTDGSVLIRQTSFSQIHSNNDVEAIRLGADGGTITVENSQFDNVSVNNNVNDNCAVEMDLINEASLLINHLSADIANARNFCVGNSIGPAEFSATQIFNSIFWSSDGSASQFKLLNLASGTPIKIVNSVFRGVTSVPGVALTIQNQINAAPGWIDAANGNYRLMSAPLAPAINSGTVIVSGGEPATDIEGKTRLIGSAPDRGAYESLVTNQTVFTVSNTLDSGNGSLREAITLANQSITPPKSIVFNIPGACPQVIALNSVLPTITSRLSIDGYTQAGSEKNTSSNAFDAILCVLLKPAAGSLSAGFTVPANSFGSLTLRGLGLGGFGQPVRLLGGQGNVIAGNQFGSSHSGVALPGASLNAISIGSSGAGVLIGGVSAGERNYISGAGTSGVDNSAIATAAGSCQIVNNLIFGNNFGINNTGDGCQIVGNRVYGNNITHIWLNGGNNNVVARNLVGLNTADQGVPNNTANGILVTGSGNIIGASGQGGAISANIVRFNNAGGIIVKGDGAINNSINANVVYGNGAANNAMDIDLAPAGFTGGVGIAAPTANDVNDLDAGPNQLQNFPVGTSLLYTGAGTGVAMLDRPATVTAVLDSQPGTHRIDAYYSPTSNPLGQMGVTPRGHGEIYLGHRDVFALFPVPVSFTMPVSIPTQLASGVISFTATDANGNTSEIGTGMSIVAPLIDDVFKNGFE